MAIIEKNYPNSVGYLTELRVKPPETYRVRLGSIHTKAMKWIRLIRPRQNKTSSSGFLYRRSLIVTDTISYQWCVRQQAVERHLREIKQRTLNRKKSLWGHFFNHDLLIWTSTYICIYLYRKQKMTLSVSLCPHQFNASVKEPALILWYQLLNRAWHKAREGLIHEQQLTSLTSRSLHYTDSKKI